MISNREKVQPIHYIISGKVREGTNDVHRAGPQVCR